MTTAQFVKVSRKALCVTQAQLAKALNKSRVSITNYESGKVTPPGDIILQIIELRYPNLCLLDPHCNIKQVIIAETKEAV